MTMRASTEGTNVSVRGLTVGGRAGTLVEDLSFDVRAGSITAIVGESGAGKTLTMRSLLGLLPRGLWASGTLTLGDREVDLAHTRTLARIRGREVGIVMQNPFGSLDPLLRTGRQLVEPVRRLGMMDGATAEARSRDLLTEMGFADPERIRDLYPHELSGGMSQRVAIAAAMMLSPQVLIADEPTSALDAHLRVEVLRLLRDVASAEGTAMLLVSHDLGLVSRFADDVVVMRDGRAVESGTCAEVLHHPAHEYTATLLRSSLTLDHPPRTPVPVAGVQTEEPITVPAADPSAPPIVAVTDISRRFRTRTGPHLALDGVSMQVRPGETVAVVGESGSGKTTLGRIIAGLDKPTGGDVTVLGRVPRPRPGRPSVVQVVFQNPKDALNQHWSVGRSIAEPLRRMRSAAKRARVAELLEQVGLSPDVAARRPATFSGGQLQRIVIARALAAEPPVLLCDEPTSALDVTVQAQIVNLLLAMQQANGFAMVLVTHDLGVVRVLADRVVVLHRGRVVEGAPSEAFFAEPSDAYAANLVNAVAEQSLRSDHRDDIVH